MILSGRLVSPFLRLQAIRLWRRPRLLILATWAFLIPSIPALFTIPFAGLSGPSGGKDILLAFTVGAMGGFIFSLMLAVMSAGALSLGSGARQEALMLTGLRPVHALLGNFLTFAGMSLLMALALLPAGVVAMAGGELTLSSLILCMTIVVSWPLVGFGLSQLAGAGPKDLGASPVYGGVATLVLITILTVLDISGVVMEKIPLGMACGPYAQVAGVWGDPICTPLAHLIPPEGAVDVIALCLRMVLTPLLLSAGLFGLCLLRLTHNLNERIRSARLSETAHRNNRSRQHSKPFPVHGNLVFELSKKVKTVISHKILWAVAVVMVLGWGAIGAGLQFGDPNLVTAIRGISSPLAVVYLIGLIFTSAFMVSLSFAEDAQGNRLNLLRITLVTSEEAVNGKTRALVNKFAVIHLAATLALSPVLGVAHAAIFGLVGWAYLWLGVSLGMMSARPDEPLYAVLFRSALSVGLFWVVALGLEAPLTALVNALQGGPLAIQGLVLCLKLLSRFGLSNGLMALDPLITGKVVYHIGLLDPIFHAFLVIFVSRWMVGSVRKKYEYFWQNGEWPRGVSTTSVAGESMGTLAYAHQVAVPIGKGVDLVDEERGVPLQNLEVVLNPHVRKLVLPPYHQTHRSPVVNTEPVPQTPVFTPEVEGQSSSLFEKEDEVEPPPLENALEISENFTPEIPEEPPEPKP